MMRKRYSLSPVAYFLFSEILFAGTMLYAQSPTPTTTQSATQNPVANPFDSYQQFTATVSGGPAQWKGKKLYRSGNLMRGEWDFEYRLTQVRESKGWAVRGKQCFAMKHADAATYPFSAYTDFNVEQSPEKTNETLNGHPCSVENYTFKPKDGRDITIKVKLWKADDLKGFPVQIEVASSLTPKFTMNYTDVSLDPPDPKLFKIPANCPGAYPPAKKKTTGSPASKSSTSKPASKPASNSPSTKQ